VDVASDFSALEAQRGNYMAVGHAPNLGADPILFLWQLRHNTDKMKQGINSRRTGNLLSRAGNLLRLAGNCRPCAGIPPDLNRPFAGACGNSNAEASYEWSSFRKRTDQVQLSRESATLMPSVEG